MAALATRSQKPSRYGPATGGSAAAANGFPARVATDGLALSSTSREHVHRPGVGRWHRGPEHLNPSRLDARQWARAAKRGGFRGLILTAKHHDGFCLWPTRTTDHGVRISPWRGGAGDLVREFADACRAEGLGAWRLSVTVGPQRASYGQGRAYDDFYLAQLEDCSASYGPLVEVWFDGANGEGPNGKRQAYDWPRIHAAVRRLQPKAVMFSDSGPDVRWIGNEAGEAGTTCWSMVDPDACRIPGSTRHGCSPH